MFPSPSQHAALQSSPPRGQEGAAKSPIEQLSAPLLLRILQMSQPTAWDLCRMSCVSTAWRTACSHSSFWTRLRVGSGSLRPGVEQLAPRCTELTELFVDDPRCELHILHPIIIACSQSLKRVVVDCDRDTGSRNEASISSVLWLISLYCKNVESIELQSNGRDASASAGFLEGRTMWFLTSAFRNIRYFACLAKGAVTKQCVYLMAIAWRDLECVRINIEGLQLEDLLALRKCANLRALELVGGSLNPEEPDLSHSSPAHSTVHSSMTSFVQGEAARSGGLAGNQAMARAFPHANAGDQCVLMGGADAEYLDTAASRGPGTPLFREPPPVRGVSPVAELLCRCTGGMMVFHPTLELLVLNKVEFDAASVAALAMCCPRLKRILVSGALCSSCLVREGPCASGAPECVRRRVDLIQATLSQVRVSTHQ